MRSVAGDSSGGICEEASTEGSCGDEAELQMVLKEEGLALETGAQPDGNAGSIPPSWLSAAKEKWKSFTVGDAGTVAAATEDATAAAEGSGALGLGLVQRMREHERTYLVAVAVTAVIALLFIVKLAGIFKAKSGARGKAAKKQQSTKFPLKDRPTQLKERETSHGSSQNNSSNNGSSSGYAKRIAINPPPPSHSVGPGGKSTKRRSSTASGSPNRQTSYKKDSPTSDDGSVASMSTIGNNSSHLRFNEGTTNLEDVRKHCGAYPDLLVGRKLEVEKRGECLVLNVVRRLGRRTRFQIRLEDGSIEKVRLARKQRDKLRADELAFSILA